jgi:RNA polymerase sigma-70 factor (ECF subfamily)
MARSEQRGQRAYQEPVQLSAAAAVSTADLIERVRAGDPWAEEAFYRRHAPLVRATVRRLQGNSADAEDVVQDTFATAFEIWDQLREPAHAKSWLLMIAVRKVQKRFRRRRLLRTLGLDQTTDDLTLEALARPDLSSEARAELALLDAALRVLPPEARIAWMLRHVEGSSLEEVATLCECSLATIKRRIATAQQKVSEHLQLGEAQHD